MASTSTLNADHVLLLEQSTLKAPLDTLRKMHKLTQKTYEHNLGPGSSFQKELDELLRRCQGATSAAESAELLATVDGMLARMRGLKRKLHDLDTQSTRAVHVASSRLSHLAQLPATMEDLAYASWSRRRLSSHLADYFLRATPMMKASALSLAKEEQMVELVDVELWEELAVGEEGLRARRLDQVLTWVGENRTALRKLKSPLEFTIHLQAYVELCRVRKLTEAIAYVKKHLSPSAIADHAALGSQGQQMDELRRAMGLLAFPAETNCRIYRDLYAPTRWTALLSLFRSTFLTLHSLPSLPLLHLSLQAGLASLKTHVCCPLPGAKATDAATASCPICASPLKELAKEVPYSHHTNTTIVCGISGLVVEGEGDGGQLLALVSRQKPSEGNVYSKEALLKVATEHDDGRIVDPRTGETFGWDEVRKVFPI